MALIMGTPQGNHRLRKDGRGADEGVAIVFFIRGQDNAARPGFPPDSAKFLILSRAPSLRTGLKDWTWHISTLLPFLECGALSPLFSFVLFTKNQKKRIKNKAAIKRRTPKKATPAHPFP